MSEFRIVGWRARLRALLMGRGPDRVVTPVQWRAHIAAGLFWFVVAVCSVLMSWATP